MSEADITLLAVSNVSKLFGHVIALEEVSMSVHAGRVTCLLGDNGAGKSTLIKVLAGVHKPSTGRYEVGGKAVDFASPHDARERGIATVYQDLAMIPLMSVWRNFFLGSEPTIGWGPLKRIDVGLCERITRDELEKMGIDIRDTAQAVGTLSGGERQSVAIARAVYFGAKVLILDEPTAALGVKQAGIVLRFVAQAKARGVGVVLVTHNPNHAYPVGDHFVVLRRGKVLADITKDEVSLEELTRLMAGGEGLGVGN
ncbi:ATP-binding cassette domain-containing protein [Gemmatimonadota bacterium]